MKSSIRSEILNHIRSLSIDQIDEASLRIQNNLRAYFSNFLDSTWGAFQPLKDEPQIAWASVSSNIRWAFPAISAENEMNFFLAANNFRKSNFGVYEPVDGKLVPPESLNGVVAAGISFDRQGYRLGRGKGYYDRYLQNFKGKKIGVCFASAMQNLLPAEDHDVKFDAVITDREILSF